MKINNKFVKNTSWILFGNIFKMCLSFIVGILTTRYLGPSNYGLLNYVQSFTFFFVAIVSLGLNALIVNEFVRNKNSEGTILGTAILLRFIVGIAGCIVFVPIVKLFGVEDKTTLIVALIQAIQLPFLCLDTIQYFYQAKLMSKYSIIAQSVAYFGTSLYKVYLLVSGKGIEWFAFASILDIIVLGVVCTSIYIKQGFPKWKISRQVAKRLAKKCFPFVVSSIMVVIYAQIDKVMIKGMLNSDLDVGLYSAAIAICSYFGFVPNAIIESSRPLVLESKGVSNELFDKRFRQTVAAVFWICIFFSLAISIFAKLVITILYGADFLGAVFCLRVSIWYTSFSYLGSVKSIWLIAEKKNKYVMVFSILGAITNIVLNIFMIPHLGIIGAAIATLLTELLVNFIYPFIFGDTRKYSILAFSGIFMNKIEFNKMIEMIKANLKHRG